MNTERIITVNGLQFKVQLSLFYMLLIVEIDNITIMVKHTFPLEFTRRERFETLNGSKPHEIAEKEYEWLKPLLNNRSQVKEKL